MALFGQVCFNKSLSFFLFLKNSRKIKTNPSKVCDYAEKINKKEVSTYDKAVFF